ncbi:hypothetical protein NM688_g7982 [Phlebia brevispora]|uniref:Uncharacterized protein n=1 Tax=Phlebia brevispora TaxID=194682 RepID=A0ACC1RZF9_9APHY|nr:hypothetical protein NM688_g7982 [Phlebia brevispora]
MPGVDLASVGYTVAGTYDYGYTSATALPATYVNDWASASSPSGSIGNTSSAYASSDALVAKDTTYPSLSTLPDIDLTIFDRVEPTWKAQGLQ